jgi:hypothetical protein
MLTVTQALERNPLAAMAFSETFDKADVIQADINRSNLVFRNTDLVVAAPPVGLFTNPRKYHSDPDEQDVLPAVMNAITAIKPRVFLIETACEVAEADDGDYAYRLFSYLSKEYFINTAVLNAASFGVPQIKHRWYWIGLRNDVFQDRRNLEIFRWPKNTHRERSARSIRMNAGAIPLFPGDDMPGWVGRNEALGIIPRLVDMPVSRLPTGATRAELLALQTAQGYIPPATMTEVMTKRAANRMIARGTPCLVAAHLARMIRAIDPVATTVTDLCCGVGLLSWGLTKTVIPEEAVAAATAA